MPLIIAVVIIVVVAVALVAGSEDKSKKPAVASTATNTGCGAYHKDGVMALNGHLFNVEIAYDTKAKQKGLGGRPCIEPNWGMLFDFGHDGQYAFWMKDMSFPIDIIWINSRHDIAAVEPDVEPSTYNSKNPYFENDPQHLARYVLEIKANLAKQYGLEIGQPVHFQKT